METHVDMSNVFDVCNRVCNKWNCLSNGNVCSKGERIILGWNTDVVDIMLLSQSDQVVHVQVLFKSDNKSLFCSFIYVDNHYKNRRLLWSDLEKHKLFVRDRPWALLGDFNLALFLEDKVFGSSSITISMREFKECLDSIEVFDENCFGCRYTWTQKPKKGVGILKKIDRVLGNVQFISDFPAAHAIFLPYRVSDHSPYVLKLPSITRTQPKPFKFANFLADKEGFIELVADAWKQEFMGHNMFRLVKRLRSLKKPFRKLLFDQGDTNGVTYEGGAAAMALVTHYEKFLGRCGDTSPFVHAGLFQRFVDASKAVDMVREVTREEIKSAIFNIGDNKTPGPDGFSSAFFKKTWSIVGHVCLAIEDFFQNGSTNQFAFVPSRRIADNILLTQELMHNYHRKSGPPRCAFKVDIQKAYDTVDWEFLKLVLHDFRFPEQVVNWVMACVSSTSFSISVNGNLYGYFKGKRGLRQGDPISPYLFTLVMEVLTLKLQQLVQNSLNFRYHNKCEKQRLVNLCFADDLFLFSRGDVDSARVILEALSVFKDVSGLVPSITKSTVFFCNVTTHVRNAIMGIMPFDEGQLPIKYLGVPLISTRLVYRDCMILVERLDKRIDNWKNKTLSLAGRIQLIRSVLSSMYIYWASVFILPARIVRELEKKLRGFLWNHGRLADGRAHISRQKVCLPKCEGGLGIRKISDVNISLMASHIWCILCKKNTLWVEWVYSYKLKGTSFWEVKPQAAMSWGWRKLLQLRNIVRPHFISKIGSGEMTSVWYDMWHPKSLLSRLITPREIARNGFSLQSTIKDVISNGVWRWSIAWYDLFPVLINVQPPNLIGDKKDELVWMNRSGKEEVFSTRAVWDTIRVAKACVPWVKLVWYSQCIPRHSFHVWRILKRKLKTQDKLRPWEVGGATNLNLMCCSLCNHGPDSHDHLFFKCFFSFQVWSQLKSLSGMHGVGAKWRDIVDWLLPLSKSSSIKSVLGRLLLAATAYFIWQERNARLFTDMKRSVNQLVAIIMDTVRLKLVSLRFKSSAKDAHLLVDWQIPASIIV
uniref:uncharacterized protein LOC122601294 n=1 Tax=Erigeron canadensis TaxID=72917 RepID=UPI001CB88F29|nr:uncharacterized protein LOC122601294 [Erigeron canadensis]